MASGPQTSFVVEKTQNNEVGQRLTHHGASSLGSQIREGSEKMERKEQGEILQWNRGWRMLEVGSDLNYGLWVVRPWGHGWRFVSVALRLACWLGFLRHVATPHRWPLKTRRQGSWGEQSSLSKIYARPVAKDHVEILVDYILESANACLKHFEGCEFFKFSFLSRSFQIFGA